MLRDFPSIPGLSSDQVATLVNCRSLKQHTDMITSCLAGTCVFCDPLDPVKNKIIHQNALWRMWINPYPLPNTRLHLILAPYRHVAPNEPVSQKDFACIGDLFMWAQEEFKLPGGGLLMRFGAPEHNAGTVLHLHANIIIPDGAGEVRLPLAKEPEKVAETINRMWVFEKLRNGASLTDLTPEEARLVEGRV